MISILIPIYNWNITDLALRLSQQIFAINTEIEVIFYDDCSTDKLLIEINRNVVKKYGFNYISSIQNRGIADALNYLESLAKYDWLLYLDADVFPVQNDFIFNYLSVIGKQNRIYCGGILYQNKEPSEGTLRWRYGRKYEVQTKEIANENPYLNFKACNFLVHKVVIQCYPFESNNGKEYAAVDTLFGLKLKNTSIEIEFIENRVYHLGLETNEIYVGKACFYAKSIAKEFIRKTELDGIRLVSFYKKQPLFLLNIYGWVYRNFKTKITQNLVSNNPSLTLFQFYKFGLFLEELKKEKV
ncbi:glycosyltransferase family 2 protein [Empedobacter tilapiae]